MVVEAEENPKRLTDIEKPQADKNELKEKRLSVIDGSKERKFAETDGVKET